MSEYDKYNVAKLQYYECNVARLQYQPSEARQNLTVNRYMNSFNNN